jgi:hypothetical protein
MASPTIIQKIKTDLRIRHAELDEDISDSIDSCVADLSLCGVSVDDDRVLDRNIVNAIKLWCRSRYTHDIEEAKLYEQRYNSVKSTLMSSKGYRRADDDTDE